MDKKLLMQPLLSAILILLPHIIGQCTKIHIFHLYPTFAALMDKKITHATSPISHLYFLPHIIGQCTKIHIFDLYPTSVALWIKKSLTQPLLSPILNF